MIFFFIFFFYCDKKQVFVNVFKLYLRRHSTLYLKQYELLLMLFFSLQVVEKFSIIMFFNGDDDDALNFAHLNIMELGAIYSIYIPYIYK